MDGKQKTELRIRAAAISLYGNLKRDAAIIALTAMLAETDPVALASHAADYYGALNARGFAQNASGYFLDAALHDKNAFSKAAAAGEQIALSLTQLAATELETLQILSKTQLNDFAPVLGDALRFLPAWQTGEPCANANKSASVNAGITVADFSVKNAADCYSRRGYGVFADSVAYTFNVATKSFESIKNINPIRLADLKNYEDEKNAVADNTLSFIERLPANNVLLYGDRGTGKSSTVHAILNEYADRGLRLVETSKAAIPDFPKIIAALSEFAFRFVLFLDDLTFIEGADDYAELKAALEGSVSKSNNVLIYATTNRMHLLKENFSAREGDDIHAADTVEEQMSLSDRFGLVVTFLNPDKREFFSILKQILFDRGLFVDDAQLSLAAERYALRKGGRSPRAAKQLADKIESRLKRNLPLDV